MSPVFRTLLMCLLMLAIPVQGFAASAMLHCGPSHQRQAPSMHVQMHGQMHGQYAPGSDDATQSHAHHAQHEHHAGHGFTAGEPGSAAEGGSASMGSAKCSACASCCYATALLSALPSVAVIAPDQARELTVATGFELIVPDGLERPPRSMLA